MNKEFSGCPNCGEPDPAFGHQCPPPPDYSDVADVEDDGFITLHPKLPDAQA